MIYPNDMNLIHGEPSPELEEVYWNWVRQVIIDCVSTETLMHERPKRALPALADLLLPPVEISSILHPNFLVTHGPHRNECRLEISQEKLNNKDTLHQFVHLVKTVSDKSAAQDFGITIAGDFDKGPYTAIIHADTPGALAKGLNHCLKDSHKIGLSRHSFEAYIQTCRVNAKNATGRTDY